MSLNNTTNIDDNTQMDHVSRMLGLINEKPVFDKKGNIANPGYRQHSMTQPTGLQEDLYNFQKLIGGYEQMKHYFPFEGPLTADLTAKDKPKSYFPYDRYGVPYIHGGGNMNIDNLAAGQGIGSEMLHGLGRILPFTALETVAGLGSMVDTIDFLNILDSNDVAFSDNLHRWANDQKEKVREVTPIYEPTNSGMGDSSWWFNNGSALVASASSFFLQGGLLGKALNSVKWADSIIKTLKAADRTTKSANKLNQAISGLSKFATDANINKFKATQQFANALGTSILMTTAESSMDAVQTYDNVYQEALGRGYTEDTAKYIASEAASTIYKQNRWNVLLNMTSSMRFLKAFKGNVDDFGVKLPSFSKGFWGDAYGRKGKLNRLAGVFSANKKYDPILRDVILEGSQESLEELTNYYSSKRGQEVANALMDKDFDNVKTDFFSYMRPWEILGGALEKEGVESAILGFIGGAGQLGLTKGILHNLPNLGGKVEKRDSFGNLVYKEQTAKYENDYEIQQEGEILANDVTLPDGTEFKKGTKVTKGMLEHAQKTGDKLINKKGEEVLEDSKDGPRPVKILSDELEYEDDGKKFSINKVLTKKYNQQQEILKSQSDIANKIIKSLADANETSQIIVSLDALEAMNSPYIDPVQADILKTNLAKYMLKSEGKAYDTTVEDEAGRAEAEKNVKEQKEKINNLSEKEMMDEYNKIKSHLLSHQTRLAVENNAVEALRTIYKDLSNLTPEQAAERGLDPKTYKETAEKALQDIDKYSSIYQEYRYKYDSGIASRLYDNRVRTEKAYEDIDKTDKELTDTLTELNKNADLKDTDGKIKEKRDEIDGRRKEIETELEKLNKARRELLQGVYKIEEGKTVQSTDFDLGKQIEKLQGELKKLDLDEAQAVSDLIKNDPLLVKAEQLRNKKEAYKTQIENLDKRFEYLRDYAKKRAENKKKKAEEQEIEARSIQGVIDFYDKFNEIFKKSNAKTHTVFIDLDPNFNKDGFVISYLLMKYGQPLSSIIANNDSKTAFVKFVEENIDNALLYQAYNKNDAEINDAKTRILRNVQNAVTSSPRFITFVDRLGLIPSDTSIPFTIEWVNREVTKNDDKSYNIKGGLYRLVPLFPPITYHTSITAKKFEGLRLPGNQQDLFKVEKVEGYDDLYRVTLNESETLTAKHQHADKLRVMFNSDFEIFDEIQKYNRLAKVVEQRVKKVEREKNEQIQRRQEEIESRNKRLKDLTEQIDTESREIQESIENLKKNEELVKEAKLQDTVLKHLDKKLKKATVLTQELFNLLNNSGLPHIFTQQDVDNARVLDENVKLEILARIDLYIDNAVDVQVNHLNEIQRLNERAKELTESVQKARDEYSQLESTNEQDLQRISNEIDEIQKELDILKNVEDVLNKNLTYNEVKIYKQSNEELYNRIKKLREDLKPIEDQLKILDIILKKPSATQLKKEISTLETVPAIAEVIEQVLENYENLDDTDFQMLRDLFDNLNEQKDKLLSDLEEQSAQLETLKEVYYNIKELAKEDKETRERMVERANRGIIKALRDNQPPPGEGGNQLPPDNALPIEEYYEDYGSESYFKSGTIFRTSSLDVMKGAGKIHVNGRVFVEDRLTDDNMYVPNPSKRQRHNSIALNQLAAGRLRDLNGENKINLSDPEQAGLVVRYVLASDDAIKNELFYSDGELGGNRDDLIQEFNEAGIKVDDNNVPYIDNIDKFKKYLTKKKEEVGNLNASQQQSFSRLEAMSEKSSFTIQLWDDYFRFNTIVNQKRETTDSGIAVNGRGLYVLVGKIKDKTFKPLYVDTDKQLYNLGKEKGFNGQPILLTLHTKRIPDNNPQELAAQLYTYYRANRKGETIEAWMSYEDVRNKVLNTIVRLTEAEPNKKSWKNRLEEASTPEAKINILKEARVNFGDFSISIYTLDNLRNEVTVDMLPEDDRADYVAALNYLHTKANAILSEFQTRVTSVVKKLDDNQALVTDIAGISDGFVKRRVIVTENENTIRDFSPIIGENGVINNVNEITHFEIPIKSATQQKMTAVGTEKHDYQTKTRRLVKGKAYIRTKDGDIVPVFARKLNETEQQFVIDAIRFEYQALLNGEFDPITITTLRDETGKEISTTETLPLIRVRENDPNKDINLISRLLFWSGIPRNKEEEKGKKKKKKKLTELQEKAEEKGFEYTGRKSYSIFFWSNKKDEGKLYLAYGTKDVSLEELFSNDAAMQDFKEWLSKRPININKKYLKASSYYSPQKIEKIGDRLVVTVKTHNQTSKTAQNAYISYLAKDGVLFSDVLSEEESVRHGFKGERTVGRYLILSNTDRLATETAKQLENKEKKEKQAAKAKTKAGEKPVTTEEEGKLVKLIEVVSYFKSENGFETQRHYGKLTEVTENSKTKVKTYIFADGTKITEQRPGQFFTRELKQEEYNYLQKPNRVLDNETATLQDLPFNKEITLKMSLKKYDNGKHISNIVYKFTVVRKPDSNHNLFDPLNNVAGDIENSRHNVEVVKDFNSFKTEIYEEVLDNGTVIDRKYRDITGLEDFVNKLQNSFDDTTADIYQLNSVTFFAKSLLQRDVSKAVLAPEEGIQPIINSPLSSLSFLKMSSNSKLGIYPYTILEEAKYLKETKENKNVAVLLNTDFELTLNPKNPAEVTEEAETEPEVETKSETTKTEDTTTTTDPVVALNNEIAKLQSQLEILNNPESETQSEADLDSLLTFDVINGTLDNNSFIIQDDKAVVDNPKELFNIKDNTSIDSAYGFFYTDEEATSLKDTDTILYGVMNFDTKGNKSKKAFKDIVNNLKGTEFIIEGDTEAELDPNVPISYFVKQELGTLQRIEGTNTWEIVKKNQITIKIADTVKPAEKIAKLNEKILQLEQQKDQLLLEQSKPQIPEDTNERRLAIVDYFNSLQIPGIKFKALKRGDKYLIGIEGQDTLTTGDVLNTILDKTDDETSVRIKIILNALSKLNKKNNWENIPVQIQDEDFVAKFSILKNETRYIKIGNGFIDKQYDPRYILLHEIIHHYTKDILDEYYNNPDAFKDNAELTFVIESLKKNRDLLITEFLQSKDDTFKDIDGDQFITYLLGTKTIKDDKGNTINLFAELNNLKNSKANKKKVLTAEDFYNHLNSKFTNEVQQKPVVQENQTVSKEGQNILDINYTQQKTSIEIEIIGNSGKKFLLTRNRNSSKYSLWSEKQQDGSYKPSTEYPTKDEINNLVNKYIPKSLQKAIDEWVKINTSQDNALNKSKQFEEETLDPLINAIKNTVSKNIDETLPEVTIVKLNPVIESLRNDVREFVSGIFENKQIQQIASKLTVTNDTGLIETLLNKIWDYIKSIIENITGIDNIDPNNALFDSIKKTSVIIQKSSNFNLGSSSVSSYPKQTKINYEVTVPKNEIPSSQVTESVSMYPEQSLPSNSQQNDMDLLNSYDQLFEINFFDNDVDDITYIDKDLIKFVVDQEETRILQAKHLANRLFEEDNSHPLIPVILKDIGVNYNDLFDIIENSDISDNLDEELSQAGDDLQELIRQVILDHNDQYENENTEITYPYFYNLLTERLTFDGFVVNIPEIVRSLYNLHKRDPNNNITEQLVSSLGKSTSIEDFDQQANDIAELIFEDGNRLTPKETRSLFNGISSRLFHNLIVDNTDPEKLMDAFTDYLHLENEYNKALDGPDGVIEQLTNRIEQLEEQISGGELSVPEKAEYKKVIDRITEIRDKYLKEPNHRQRVLKTHAVTELLAFSILVDEDAVDELEKGKEVNQYNEAIHYNTKDNAPPIVRLLLAAIPEEQIIESTGNENPENVIKSGRSIINIDNFKFYDTDAKRQSTARQYFERKRDEAKAAKESAANELERRKARLKEVEYSNYLNDGRVINFRATKDNIFGLTKPADYDKAYNLIQKQLKNVKTDFDTIIYKIENLYIDQLNLNNGLFGLHHLVTKLKEINTNQFDVNNIIIRNAFVQQFTKTEQKHFIILFAENGDIYPIEANAENIKSVITNEWNRNFKTLLKEYNITHPNENQSLESDKLILNPDYITLMKSRLTTSSSEMTGNQRLQLVLKMLGIEVGNFDKFRNLFNATYSINLDKYIDDLLTFIADEKNDIINKRSNIYDSDSPVKGRINNLVEVASKIVSEVYENQYVNPTGETVYTLSLYHYMTDITDKLNSLNDERVLSKFDSEEDDLSVREKKIKVLEAYAPHLLNIYTRNSKLLNMLLSDQGITLESSIFSGIRPESMFELGTETQDLSPPDLYAQRFNSVLNGLYPVSQTADRKLSNAFRIVPNQVKADNIGQSSLANMLYPSMDSALDGFVGYLIDELNLMIHTNLHPENKIIYYNDKDEIEKTKSNQFRYFDNILSQETKNLLKEVIKGEINFIENVDDLTNKIKDTFPDRPELFNIKNKTGIIKKEIKNHFDKSIAETKASLKRNGITDLRPRIERKIGNKKVYEGAFILRSTDSENITADGYQGISTNLYETFLRDYKLSNLDNLEETVLNKMIEAFVTNQEGMYIEQSKLFFGDPAFFKNEDDLFKRYKMYTSSKQISVNDEGLNDAFNQYTNLYAIDNDGNRQNLDRDTDITTLEDTNEITYNVQWGYRSDNKQADGLINTVIVDDVKTYSKYAFNGNNIEKIEYDGSTKTLSYYTKDADNNLVKLDNDQIPPLVKGFAESFVNDGITDSKSLSSRVSSFVDLYLGYDETDGQGFITLDEYKELMIRNGLSWTRKHQKAYFKAIQGKVLSLDELALFQPLKTQYTGPIMDFIKSLPDGSIDQDATIFVPTGYKHSLTPLIPSMVKGTQLEKVLNSMKQHQVGILQFVSGNKYGTKLNPNNTVNKFYDDNGNIPDDFIGDNVTQKIAYDYIGIQVSIQPKLKGYAPVGSQPRKLILVNAFNRGVLNKALRNKEYLVNDYINIQEEIINRKLNNLKDELGIIEVRNGNQVNYRITDINKVIDILLNESKQRGNSINIQRSILALAIEYIRASAKTNKKGAYIEELLNRSKIENILMAIFDARIIREKRPGEAFVQMTSAGNESTSRPIATDSEGNHITTKSGSKIFTTGNDLLYYEQGYDAITGEEATVPAEVKIPLPKKWIPWVNSTFGGLEGFNRELDRLFDKVHKLERPSLMSTDENPVLLRPNEVDMLRLLTVVGFRIPNQGLNSTEALRIRNFLPTESGIAAVVPSEIVPKTGGDFDVDKLQAYLSSFTLDKKGKPLYRNYIDDISSLTEAEKLQLFKDRVNESYTSDQKEMVSYAVMEEGYDTIKQLEKEKGELSKEKRGIIRGVRAIGKAIKNVSATRNEVLDDIYHEGFEIFRKLPKIHKTYYWELNKKLINENYHGVQKQEQMKIMTNVFINEIKKSLKDQGYDNVIPAGILMFNEAANDSYKLTDEDKKYDAAQVISILEKMNDNYSDWLKKFYEMTDAQMSEYEKEMVDLVNIITSLEGAKILNSKDIIESVINGYNESINDLSKKIAKLHLELYETLASVKDNDILPFNTFEEFTNFFNNHPLQFNTLDSLHNKILQTQHEILRLPYNYRQLTAPISDDLLRGDDNGVVWDVRFLEAWNKNSDNYFKQGEDVLKSFLAEVTNDMSENDYDKLYNKYRSEFIDKWNEIFIKNKSLTHVISHENNMRKHKAFLVGKKNVGIVARHVTHHALSQQVNLMLNTPIVINEKFDIVNNPAIYFDANFTLVRNNRQISFKYSLHDLYKFTKKEDGLYKTNKDGSLTKVLEAGDKLYLSFADQMDVDKNYISETLSAFVNAYVDVAKDPYVFDMNGVTALANTYFMMIRSGASLKWITKFLNQPIVKKYLEAQARNEAAFAVMHDISLPKTSLAMSVMSNYDLEGYKYKYYTTTDWYKLSKPTRVEILNALRTSGAGKYSLDAADKAGILDDYYQYLDDYKSYQDRKGKTSLLYALKDKAYKAPEAYVNETTNNYTGDYSNLLNVSKDLTALSKTITERLKAFDSKRLDKMLSTDFENLENTSENRDLVEDQKIILNVFLEYQRMAGRLRDAMNATSADTYGLPKNIEALKEYLNTSNNFINDNEFKNLQKVDEITVIKPFKKVLKMAYEVYRPYYLTESNDIIRTKLDTIKSIVTTLKPKTEHERIKDIVNNEFINFILHSNFNDGVDYIDSEYVYRSLIKGDKFKNNEIRYSAIINGKRIPISLLQVMNHLMVNNINDLKNLQIQISSANNNIITLDNVAKLKALKNNIFVKEVVIDPSEEDYNWDEFINKKHKNSKQRYPVLTGKLTPTLKLLSRKKTSQQQNELTKGLEEIRDLYPELYKDLFKLAIAQSGVGGSFGSYFDIIPANDYIKFSMPLINHIISNLSNSQLENYLNEFERQFWHRSVSLLPRYPKNGKVKAESLVARYPAVARKIYNKETDKFDTAVVFASHYNTTKNLVDVITPSETVTYDNYKPIIGNRHRFIGYMYSHDLFSNETNTLLDKFGKKQIEEKVPELLIPTLSTERAEVNFPRVFNQSVITQMQQGIQNVVVSDNNVFPDLKMNDKARIVIGGNEYVITYLGNKNVLAATQLLAKAAQRRVENDINFTTTNDIDNFSIAYGEISSSDPVQEFIKDTTITKHIYEIEKLSYKQKLDSLKPLKVIPKGWITSGARVFTSEYDSNQILDVTSKGAKQYSAMYVRLKPGNSNYGSMLIEEIYQKNIKGYGKAKARKFGDVAFNYIVDEKGNTLKGKPLGRKVHKLKKIDSVKSADALKKVAADQGKNPIFVFGSNTLGIHGAGAADAAIKYFGATKGVGKGLQGNAYGLVTKDGTKLKDVDKGKRSISKDEIMDNIAELYQEALNNPNNMYFVAYSHRDGEQGLKYEGLNGYTTKEMMEMFATANGYTTEIPDNIIFEESFAYGVAYEQYKNLFKQYLLVDYPDKFTELKELANDKVLQDTYAHEKTPYKSVNQARVLYEILMEEENQNVEQVETETTTQSAQQTSKYDLNETIHFHGDATGADSIFRDALQAKGIKSIAFTVANSKDQIGDNSEAAKAYVAAAQYVGRNLATNPYVIGLLRRNYLQIKDAQAVYAFSRIIDHPKGINRLVVDGGTGYGVAMAIKLGLPVFVYNDGTAEKPSVKANGWYKWNYNTNTFDKIDNNVKIEYKHFAGIGSSDRKGSEPLSETAKQEIKNLVDRSFPNESNYPALKSKIEKEIDNIIQQWMDNSQECI